ncbi:ribulose-phosphate 3-epimerase [Natribacillus halophilus]|uniref:Ribulose-phosphate 3-epimerase n=1 Tax=Natribacillus halophilus TaxID=549003 RepID=A0A1G8MIA8_9BACI|nr:ribulose-phosphate 3-epimerase [Natribacillus halophilus]SDI67565.1 ribulose-5-phosphate 3-epimerase [Natribacillus halophilus]
MVKIAPSILAADFTSLKEDIVSVENAGADMIHVDVMDGHFVPNITIGPLIVEASRRSTSLPLDVHLMIEQPEAFIPAFVQAGADMVTVHAETCPHLHRTIHLIKEQGAQAGVAINPHTPIEGLKHVLEDIDLVLLMTVNPGFGGQSFIHGVLEKISSVEKMAADVNKNLWIEVDGGIDQETAALCKQAGANLLVAGSYVFKHDDRREAIERLRG